MNPNEPQDKSAWSEDTIRAQTIGHVQDIYYEHGFNKRWANHSIPPEPGHLVGRRPEAGISLVGSPASMCAVR